MPYIPMSNTWCTRSSSCCRRTASLMYQWTKYGDRLATKHCSTSWVTKLHMAKDHTPKLRPGSRDTSYWGRHEKTVSVLTNRRMGTGSYQRTEKPSLFFVSKWAILVRTLLRRNLCKNQIDAQYLRFVIFYCVYYIPLHVLSSNMLIIRRLNCINTASGVVTLAVRCTGWERTLTTCAPNGHLQRVTLTDAVLIRFNLLMMSMLLLKTCTGM
jgi:hypothetical protein